MAPLFFTVVTVLDPLFKNVNFIFYKVKKGKKGSFFL